MGVSLVYGVVLIVLAVIAPNQELYNNLVLALGVMIAILALLWQIGKDDTAN